MQRSPDDNFMIIEKKEDATNKGNILYERKARRVNNGWATQLETLAAEWADKASCYRWMHEKTETRYVAYNLYLTMPVIILSTLTGTASFGIESMLSDLCKPQYAGIVLGTVSVIIGMISTMANFLRYAQSSEAHRVSAISWGKFQRFVTTELSLHPNERMDAMSFLKMARVEIDRLIEQSPLIPSQTLEDFKKEFKTSANLTIPEIAGGLVHTKIYVDRESRLAKVAADAAFILQQKKGLLRQLIHDDFDKHIVERTKAEREKLENEIMGEVMKTVINLLKEKKIDLPETLPQINTQVAAEHTPISITPHTFSPSQVTLEIKDE